MIQDTEGATVGGMSSSMGKSWGPLHQRRGGPQRGGQTIYPSWQEGDTEGTSRCRSVGSFRAGVMEVLLILASQ